MLSLIAEKNINSVVITDKDGCIEWVNTSFLEMSGFSMEEIIKKNQVIYYKAQKLIQKLLLI